MEPLASFLWILFLVWSLIIAIIWFGDIGEAELLKWFGGVQGTGERPSVRQPELFAACRFLLSVADTIWIVLGAANVYLALTLREGLSITRRRAMASLALIWIVSALSVWTDWPLGDVHFTDRLGMKLGPVPLGWILLLFCLLFGARDLAFGLFPKASHARAALLTGMIVAIAGFPLSLVAWKTRAWIIWYPRIIPAPSIPPIAFYASLLLVGFATAWLCRESQVTATTSVNGKPAAVYLIFVAFLGVLAGIALASAR